MTDTAITKPYLGENSRGDVDVDEGRENSDNSRIAKELENESQSAITIRPTGLVQFFNESNNDVLEGTVYEATWKGNVPFNCALNSGSPTPPQPELKPPAGSNGKSNDLAFIGIPGLFPKASPPPANNQPKSSLTFADCGGLTKQVKTAVLDTLSSKKSTSSPLEQRFKLQPPKGILFYGPPGTGKTRLAQALGNEVGKKLGSDVHFIYRKGQDIASKYFGQSSTNLRGVFEEAKSKKHCILFFDELDGLCPTRDKPHINQANVTIVTTMLGLLDELPQGQVFVIGATNRLDAIDPALRRPGRFDKYLEFLPPAQKGRLDILNIHTKKWKAKPDEGILKKLSEQTVGYTGADLSKLCLDAFDEALSRCLAPNTGLMRNLDLSNLEVMLKDWNNALRKMKPSNLAIFGSTLYTPTSRFGNHLDALIREDCAEIETMLLTCLEHETRKDLNICSMYVYTQEEGSVLSSIDEIIMPKVFRSPKLGSHPVYTISPEVLLSTAKTNWPVKVSSAFRQALEATDAILYISDVQELWDTIKAGGLSMALDLKGHLERVRGTSLLILATASIPASELSPDNPFKGTLSMSDNSFEVECPSEDERKEYFMLLFGYFLLDNEWEQDEIVTLNDAYRKAVESTNEKDIGAVVQLHDMILQNYFSKVARETDTDGILRSLFEVTSIYEHINSN